MMVILGEKLRCISDKLHWFEVNNIYEVVAINGSGSDMKISFKNCEIEIHSCQLDSFERIPAVQKYTFDDLIDAIKKASQDGVIKVDNIHFTSELSRSFIDHIQDKNSEDFEDHINFIQSLYKETFVIECEEDIKRIKKGAEITLSNGNKDNVMNTDTYKEQSMVQFSENSHWGNIGLFFLKGATVEQEK